MTNEEYRKTLKQKNSAISELKRELDSTKTAHAAKIKELDFSLAQATKKAEQVTAENKSLLEKFTEM
jgi:hypothetical protein